MTDTVAKCGRKDHIRAKCEKLWEKHPQDVLCTIVYGMPPNVRLYLTCGWQSVLSRHVETSRRLTYKHPHVIRKYYTSIQPSRV
jgi:hypothetical protein